MKKFYKSLSLLLGFVSFASWSDNCVQGLSNPSDHQLKPPTTSVAPSSSPNVTTDVTSPLRSSTKALDSSSTEASSDVVNQENVIQGDVDAVESPNSEAIDASKKAVDLSLEPKPLNQPNSSNSTGNSKKDTDCNALLNALSKGAREAEDSASFIRDKLNQAEKELETGGSVSFSAESLRVDLPALVRAVDIVLHAAHDIEMSKATAKRNHDSAVHMVGLLEDKCA